MAVERKDTEKLVDELMKMNIPAYEPSANHVQLSNTGIITRYTKIIIIIIINAFTNLLPPHIDIHIANMKIETSLICHTNPKPQKQNNSRYCRPLGWLIGNAFTKIHDICIRWCQ
mgnify:CR=1 FL=1